MCELGDKKERSLYKHHVTFFGAHEKKDIASFSPCAFNVTGFLIVIFRTCHYPAEDAHFLLQLASNFILTCAAADKQTNKEVKSLTQFIDFLQRNAQYFIVIANVIMEKENNNDY